MSTSLPITDFFDKELSITDIVFYNGYLYAVKALHAEALYEPRMTVCALNTSQRIFSVPSKNTVKIDKEDVTRWLLKHNRS